MPSSPQMVEFDTLGTLASRVAESCRHHGWKMAAAESCTGGLIAAAMTSPAGVSDVFMGCAVTYSNEAKHDILGIDAEEISEFGAVSEQVARSMAYNACTRFDADCALATTGVAGPSGGSEDKPVGTVDIAVALRGKITYQRHLFTGNRQSIRMQAAHAALSMLLHELKTGMQSSDK